MKTRGPDACGTWLDSLGRVGLVATRLEITGPGSQGAQPMRDPASGAVLIFNGEIYNHLELRRLIMAQDREPFRGSSDTETVLRLLRLYGPKCLDRLEGMFAVALWTPRSHQLLLARDRSGQKPLYWSQTLGGLAFASEIGAMFAAGLVPPIIRPQAVADYFVTLATPNPDTFFENVHALEAATTLTVDADAVVVHHRRYWSAAALLNDPLPQSARDVTERSGILLRQAIATMTATPLPFSMLLSGGVDSQLMAAALTDGHGALPATCDTIVPSPATEIAEGGEASRVAHSLGLGDRHRIHSMTAQTLFDHHRRLTARRLDTPTATLDSAMLFGLCRNFSMEGMRLCLAGEGADEIAGYPAHLRHQDAPLKRFIQAFTPDQTASLWVGTEVDGIESRLGHWDEVDATYDLGGLDRILSMEFSFRLPSFMAPRIDAPSMAAGVELRCPFLHEPLVDFMLRTPAAIKFARCEPKAPFKALHRARFGSTPSPKRGFGQPFSALLTKGTPGLWNSLLREDPNLRLTEFIDIVKLDRHLRAEKADGFKLFTVYALELWLQTIAKVAPVASSE